MDGIELAILGRDIAFPRKELLQVVGRDHCCYLGLGGRCSSQRYSPFAGEFISRGFRTVEPNVSRGSVGIVQDFGGCHTLRSKAALCIHLLCRWPSGGRPPSPAHFSRRTREGDQVFYSNVRLLMPAVVEAGLGSRRYVPPDAQFPDGLLGLRNQGRAHAGSVTPKSRKVGMSVGSAAASPQMPTQMPASAAAWPSVR